METFCLSYKIIFLMQLHKTNNAFWNRQGTQSFLIFESINYKSWLISSCSLELVFIWNKFIIPGSDGGDESTEETIVACDVLTPELLRAETGP